VSYTFMTTDLGVLSQTLSVTDNPFVTASVETVNSGNDVRLTVSDVDMAPVGLRGAGNIIAQYLDRAVSAGGDGVDIIAASVVNSGSISGAQAIYDELAPSAYLDKFSVTYQGALKFSDSMMSCSVPSGLNAPGAEGSCNWSRTTVGQNTQDSSGGLSADTNTINSAFGLQRLVGDGDWRVGGAFGIMQAETTSDAGDRSVATNLQIGASLKYAPGPFVLAGAISSSSGDVNTTRYVTIGEETQRLSGETTQRTFSFKLRGSYVHESGSLYVKPQADFNATLVKSDDFSETGGSAALQIDGMNEVIFSIAPAVEVGVTHRDEDGGVLRAFGRIGATFQSKGGVDLSSALASDTTGVTGFTLGTNGDTEVLNLGMGFTAFNVGGWSTEAQINWNIGERTNEHIAMVKLRTTF
jgi:outer membrane autotransporter protein